MKMTMFMTDMNEVTNLLIRVEKGLLGICRLYLFSVDDFLNFRFLKLLIFRSLNGSLLINLEDSQAL